MPWTGQEFAQRNNKKLHGAKASKAAAVANAVLAKTGNEGSAIRIANAVAKGTVRRHGLDSMKG